MRRALIAVALTASLVTAGCNGDSNTTTGTAVGAVTGAVVGTAIGGRTLGGRVAGALIGGALGAFIGHEIGRHLDERDRMYEAQTADTAMTYGSTGRPRRWHNSKSGNHGTITPTTAKYQKSGRVCRKFQETITLANGKSKTIDGERCQKPDGSWEFIG
jgi:surface antigen